MNEEIINPEEVVLDVDTTVAPEVVEEVEGHGEPEEGSGDTLPEPEVVSEEE